MSCKILIVEVGGDRIKNRRKGDMKETMLFTTWSVEKQKKVVATFEFEALDPTTTVFPDSLSGMNKLFKHSERRLPVNNFPIEGENYYVLRAYEGGSYALSKEELRGLVQAQIAWREKAGYNASEFPAALFFQSHFPSKNGHLRI